MGTAEFRAFSATLGSIGLPFASPSPKGLKHVRCASDRSTRARHAPSLHQGPRPRSSEAGEVPFTSVRKPKTARSRRSKNPLRAGPVLATIPPADPRRQREPVGRGRDAHGTRTGQVCDSPPIPIELGEAAGALGERAAGTRERLVGRNPEPLG